MTKSKLLLGSINATRLIDELKKNNKAFYKSQNSNDIFVNVKVWLNEEKDQFKNDASIQINPSAENKEDAKYIGNLRFLENKINYTIGDTVMSSVDLKPLGTCTGFTHNNTCILIDGKCWGGKYYFEKYNG
jgi:hypothetical protein